MNARSPQKLLKNCDHVSNVLKALSHPVRLKILCHILGKECSVNELATLCGSSQSAMSQFLGKMKSDGLITSRRESNFVFYSISNEDLGRLLGALKEIYS